MELNNNHVRCSNDEHNELLETKLEALEKRLQNLTTQIRNSVVTKGFDTKTGPKTQIEDLDMFSFRIWTIGVAAGDYDNYGYVLDQDIIRLRSEILGHHSNRYIPQVCMTPSDIRCESVISHSDLQLTSISYKYEYIVINLRKPRRSIIFGAKHNAFMVMRVSGAKPIVMGRRNTTK
ncbi:MAG: hypothetical protein ACYC1M_08270 [Armatimonadota bacterium]